MKTDRKVEERVSDETIKRIGFLRGKLYPNTTYTLPPKVDPEKGLVKIVEI